ncbi:lantibiotic dehydratase [Actinocorallia sp. API 0066]|nr:lantibiotic dehydratase [Actinocorallia sp. API 0066]
MFLASRQAGSIASSPRQLLDGRAASTVRSYTLRARSRPTPHGVFAGVCCARFTESASDSLSIGDAHRARTVPHPSWLADVAALVLDDPDVLPLLTLSTNALAVRRGDRWEHEQPAEPGVLGVRRISVRATDAATLVMSECAQGARWSDLLAAVTRAWPVAPEQPVRSMVLELVRCGFLVTDLLPEQGGDDPLTHLLARLPVNDALRARLEKIRVCLADADRLRPGAAGRLEFLSQARDLADQIVSPSTDSHKRGRSTLSVDVAVDGDLALPRRLASEAAQAAEVLWRINPRPDPLADYHRRFKARYGPHRFVPLLDTIDPVAGIGFEEPEPSSAMSARTTAVLGTLIAEAAGAGRVEVELGAATVEALATAAGSRDAVPPRTAEIQVRVIADSLEDAAAGRIRLAVCSASNTQDAGSSTGRFSTLVPGLAYPDHADDALVAELVVRARTPNGSTLAAPTGFASHRIALGVPARPGDLDVADLMLMSDGPRLWLWSQHLGRPVIPMLYSRLASRLLPPAAQLLRLLSNHGSRPLRTWSWGPLADTPFQPRVRHRSTILSPARWVLPPSLTGATRDTVGWDVAVARWRKETVPTPPDVIVIHEHDRALPLDLRRPDDLELLRRYVSRGVPAVTEQPGGPDAVQDVVAGPSGRHLLELVVPLARAHPPAPPHTSGPGAVRRIGEDLHLPGSDWLSLTIRTPGTCQDEVLARISALADELPTQQWFWLRYTDQAGPHLRVRFHGDPAILCGEILPAFSNLVTRLIGDRLASGFSVEPYEQETERYGGSAESIAAAEAVFAAGSRLVLAALPAAPDASDRIVIAALSAAAISRALSNGDPATVEGRHVDRAARRHLTGLRPRTRAASGGLAEPALEATRSEWVQRETALSTYRDVLPPPRARSCASSLIHMHVNRIIGATGAEPLVRALAADLLYLRPAPTSTR